MVGEDYGLLTGLGNAISGGLTEYKAQKDKQYNRNLQAGLLNDKGLLVDPNTGVTTLSPEEQNKRELANQSNLSGLENYQAGNKKAQDLEAWNKSQLKDADLTEMYGSYPTNKSVHDQEEFMKHAPDIMKAKYGVQGRELSNNRMQDSLDLRKLNMNNQIVTHANTAVTQDKVLGPYIQRADGAQKILELIDAGRKGEFATNKALLGQLNAEIARLETGSQAPGLGASEKTEMESSSANLRSLYDKLTSGVSSVDLEPQFQQAEGMVKHLGGSYARQIDNRMKVIRAGQLQAAQPIFDAKHRELLDNYGPSFGYTPSYAKKTAPAAGTAPTPAVTPPPPKKGDIVEGYKFKGGAVNDENNWEKQ